MESKAIGSTAEALDPMLRRMPKPRRRQRDSGPRVAYSPDEAAAMIGCGRDKVFIAMKQGQLKFKKFGRLTLITPDAIQDFIDRL